MKDITNKYHRINKVDDRPLNIHFDIKDVSKRTYQLGLATLFTGIALSIYTSFIGLYVSSFVSACFCFAILMVILLKYNGDIENLTIFIVTIVCVMLVSTAAIEGLQSGQYLYFFPLMMSIPIIVDLKQTQYKDSFIYIGIIIVSFLACILIGHNVKPLEAFTPSQLGKLSFVNNVIAISSTIIFAVSYIFFEKKYIHQLKEQSQKVIDSRTQFLATMGHELRTPLNGIIGVINLMKQQNRDAQQDEYYQILKYCSDHMLQQVNNILDFNKIEADKLEIHPVELNMKLFMKNVGMPFITLFQEKGLDLKIHIDPELDVNVLADDVRLIQIFNNLLSNALKFTDKGFVKLDVTCKRKEDKFIEVGFSIEDTGIGIAEKDQKKIFESFWQVYDQDTKKFIGTGLGLTICVRLLKLMGSNLVLVSEKSKGSKFSFDLKLDYAAYNHKQLPKNKAAEKDNLEGVKLLLVEDNQINMMVAKKILTGFKAEVTPAFDGAEALAALIKAPDFDIILMDLEMPVMDGFTAIHEVKKLYPEIPVIAFTASLVDKKMLSDLIDSGFVDCMLKPFQPLQLLSDIKKYLSKPLQPVT
ncbi:ATP-binding protein [Mucilaginibacter sp. BT774]|uniref:ATP-binding response regulator n=1 Tax=Mucilaginibacter sp. BT774 TaxID=3062276 RepID=UPI002675C324|nr:ATP-binding protein [Mucilaginibacter sp. BT774]MDO3628414.1 ATP-binding protein [Mucilaginibacter sp. BT774]